MTRFATRSTAALALAATLAVSFQGSALADGPRLGGLRHADTGTVMAHDDRRQSWRGRDDWRARDSWHRVEPRYGYRQPVPRRDVRRHDDGVGAAIVGGIIGLTLGAIMTAPSRQTYPATGYQAGAYGQNPTVIEHRPEPFTAEWYSWCAQRYRSFDPATGTFQPYNGPRRLCQ